MRPFASSASLLFSFALLSGACNRADNRSDAPPATSSVASTTAASASASASVASVAVPAADPSLDPAVLALAQPALACKFELGRFQSCPAADDFRMSSDAALSGEAGQRALFPMLFTSDERLRLLATSRFTWTTHASLLDQANVQKLLAQIDKETNTDVRDSLAAIAGEADFDKLGLRDDLKALGASKKTSVRRSVGYRLLHHRASPLAFEVVGALLSDPEKEVRKSAGTGLSNAASSADSPSCKLLATALAGPNGDDFVWDAAGRERCPGLPDKALAFVEAKVKKPGDVTNAVGIDYSLALDSVCDDPHKRGVKELPSPSAATRRRAFDAAARLASAEVKDPNTRHAAIRSLVACDPVRARAELGKLAKDADDFVASSAKKALDDLDKKK